MKRARSEQMQSLVLSYLKRRNYADSESSFKSEFKLQESVLEMTTRGTEEADLSIANSVSLAVFSIDEYFSSFEELLNFAEEVRGKDTAIHDIIYPIFCHLYLDLVMAERKVDAGTFFKHFNANLLPYVKDFLKVEELAHVIKPTDVDSSKKVREFRRQKYSVNMSINSHSKLLRFLHSNTCLLLMKVVNLHIHVNFVEGTSLFNLFSRDLPAVEADLQPQRDKNTKVKKHVALPDKSADEDSKQETVTLMAPSIMSPPTPASLIMDPNQLSIPDVDLKMLRSSIKTVTESKPSIGNICLHRMQDVESRGLTHACFCNGLHTISTGFEDSTATLWKLSRNAPQPAVAKPVILKNEESFAKKERKPHTFAVAHTDLSSTNRGRLSPDVSKIHLACDFYENIKTRLKATDVTSGTSGKCLRAHSGTVYASCFSHDDRYLLTCSEDTTVRLWDTSSAKNKVIYRGHAYPVWCICMSAFGLYFATGSYDKTARLWSTERTFPLRTFAGHHGDVEAVCFHGNASYLATADKTIRLWDVSSGKTVRLMLGHWAAASCLAFSPNGKYLASSGEDGRIRMWDIASGALIKEMRGHNGAVYSLDFSPDGAMLASGGVDSCLRVWNTRTAATRGHTGTDTNDPNLNPDLVGRWSLHTGPLHAVKFESSNLLHCVMADR